VRRSARTPPFIDPLLLRDRLVALIPNHPARNGSYGSTDQCPLGGLIVLVVADNTSDHSSSSTPDQSSIASSLLRFRG
jgi:hypothetical protein